ncbi:hypothetical protein WPS_32780 [Vulcanimicrobium alpinum]|uniref:Uncharacterized protein n=1 Tax=Vulcanimicrobium alpinum TaxID=3016050 RepID=A0AAN1Y0Q5_UNVUL|nr:hypothetical protein WPS_32780 [Vulcanimicrobium alpinum]
MLARDEAQSEKRSGGDPVNHDAACVRRLLGGVPRRGSRAKSGNKVKVHDERTGGNSTGTRCRYCGSHETDERSNDLRERGATFQVIVACASCGAAFAALSRN